MIGKTKKGKFIVIYGPNNIGKTTQIKLLAKRLIDEQTQVLSIKYPLYHLQPTGPLINQVLRHGKKMDPFELQKVYAQNRRDFQPTLKHLLEIGINVIAEDYVGTGIAWGMTSDLPQEKLEEINKDLLKPDISILLDGERFKQSIEKHHLHEDVNDEVWQRNRLIHQQLGQRYGWLKIEVDASPKEVHQKIWQVVYPVLEKEVL